MRRSEECIHIGIVGGYLDEEVRSKHDIFRFAVDLSVDQQDLSLNPATKTDVLCFVVVFCFTSGLRRKQIFVDLLTELKGQGEQEVGCR